MSGTAARSYPHSKPRPYRVRLGPQSQRATGAIHGFHFKAWTTSELNARAVRSQRWEQPRNSLISQMKDAEAGKYGAMRDCFLTKRKTISQDGRARLEQHEYADATAPPSRPGLGQNGAVPRRRPLRRREGEIGLFEHGAVHVRDAERERRRDRSDARNELEALSLLRARSTNGCPDSAIASPRCRSGGSVPGSSRSRDCWRVEVRTRWGRDVAGDDSQLTGRIPRADRRSPRTRSG